MARAWVQGGFSVLGVGDVGAVDNYRLQAHHLAGLWYMGKNSKKVTLRVGPARGSGKVF